MRGLVLAGAVGLMAVMATPAAAEWEFIPYTGGARAVVTVDGSSLVVACGEKGSLVAYYEFPKSALAKELEGREEVYAQFMLDQDASGTGKYFSFRTRLIAFKDGTMGVGGGGKGGLDIANWFSKGKRKIMAALATSDPASSQSYKIYVAKDFSAAGSTDAIRKVKAHCS